MDILTWLHLSDIHYAVQNFETGLMRDKLISKLQELTQNYNFDFIVITGDIADKNIYDEEKISAFFDALLNTLKLNKDNLFIVPGNHDLKRDGARENLLKSFLSSEEDFDESIIELLKNGFKKFNSFYKNYFGKDYPFEEIHYLEKRDKFNILGLNTVITSGMNKEEGSLKLYFDPLLEKLKDIETSENITIAIGHHNVDCLSPKNRDLLIDSFETYNIDLYLNGHIHDSRISLSIDGNKSIPSITCGSEISEGYGTTGFIVGKKENLQVVSKFFKWSEKAHRWILDNEVDGRQNDNGEIIFSIKNKSITSQNTQEQTIELKIDSDKFTEFIIDFHNNFENVEEIETVIQRKDIDEKFTNMKCNNTMKHQYDSLSMYFPVISDIMGSSTFISPKNKFIIQNVILEAYNKFLDQFNTGNRILEEMVQYIYNNYKNKIQYPEANLKIYIKILCFWFIYECDIFDDKKE